MEYLDGPTLEEFVRQAGRCRRVGSCTFSGNYAGR